MSKVATWMRRSDEKWFRPFFATHPEIRIENANRRKVSLDSMDGLLLTGGPDISKEFLRQPVPDPSVLEKDVHPDRDRWEFAAVKEALARELPIFAICKGLQLFNVALGGTLRLDIPGHNRREMRDHNIQPLRTDRVAAHRFLKVNSSHHQAVDQLGDGLEVEAWCATDDMIEQVRLHDYPFALAVQYHPERDARTYSPLFEDFFDRMNRMQRIASKKHSVDSVRSV
jgi:putative glutamine amidotransferase